MTETKKVSTRRREDGTYNNKPTDPDYFNKYYHTKGREMTTCPQCGAGVRKNYLTNHMNLKKCFKEREAFLEKLRELIPELDF